MLTDRPATQRPSVQGPRIDRSMAALQYAIAIVAAGAAWLLAVVR